MKESNSKRIRRTSRDYSMGFKLSVVERVENGELTYKQAQERYGIQGRSTVLVWLRKHGRLDWSKPMRLPNMTQSKETPAQEIKRLKKEIETLKQVNHVYGCMEETLIKEYGIDIRKKYSSELSAMKKRKGKSN